MNDKLFLESLVRQAKGNHHKWSVTGIKKEAFHRDPMSSRDLDAHLGKGGYSVVDSDEEMTPFGEPEFDFGHMPGYSSDHGRHDTPSNVGSSGLTMRGMLDNVRQDRQMKAELAQIEQELNALLRKREELRKRLQGSPLSRRKAV